MSEKIAGGKLSIKWHISANHISANFNILFLLQVNEAIL